MHQDLFKSEEKYNSTVSKLRHSRAYHFQPDNLAERLAAYDADVKARNSVKFFGTGQLPDDFNFETEE